AEEKGRRAAEYGSKNGELEARIAGEMLAVGEVAQPEGEVVAHGLVRLGKIIWISRMRSLPLVGRVGVGVLPASTPVTRTPTLDPSPQGGGRRKSGWSGFTQRNRGRGRRTTGRSACRRCHPS